MGDTVGLLAEVLGRHLNRTVNEKFLRTVIQFYQKKNNYEAFSAYLEVLGLKPGDATREVYDIINDNIGVLESKLGEEHKKPRKKALAILFDEEEEEEKEEKTPIRFKRKSIAKPTKSSIGLSFDEDDEEPTKVSIGTSLSDEGDEPQQKVQKAGPIFKKIKKEDAIRIKTEGQEGKEERHESKEASEIVNKPGVYQSSKSVQHSSTHLNRNSDSSSKASPAQHHSTPMEIYRNPAVSPKAPESEEFKEEDSLEGVFGGVENDREWYMADEMGHATGELYDEVEEAPVARRGAKPPSKVKRNANQSGGGFNSNGEYYDHDHEGGADYSQIPLVSHNLIPPFLEDFKHDLALQLEGSGTRGIGPTISPIKDTMSELAVAARHGSDTVKERRTKNERAKQAQERTGQKDERKEKGKQMERKVDEKERDEQEENDSVSIVQQRRSLPVFSVRNQLVQTIRENQITIVVGETGSGKTTQLAQYLYEEGFCGGNRMIGCTQPRRVAAMSVAQRVSKEVGCALGQEVGYSIRFEDKTSARTVIKYMTEGMLLWEILADPMLEKYSCIIIDEAHERSLNTDVILGLFKQLLRTRSDFKLVVTSATMNASRFSSFFGEAPQFTIPGRTFPVEVLYSKTVCTDYVEAAVKQVLTIHLQRASNGVIDGDILVFMTGQEDIEVTCALLHDKLEMLENAPPIEILPIYSTLPADLQNKIFAKSSSSVRKVVVATNIAETSLTVDGVKYVVDTGLVKLKVYNPKLGMDTLQVVPVSLANAQQRSGRAGRTGPGVAYRLYTERATEPNQMYVQPVPEIQRTNLTNVLLLLKSLDVHDLTKFPFLDPPPSDILHCSLYDLWSIGGLDNFGELTPLGRQMSRFPMEPGLAKLLLLSCRPEFHCSDEIVTIVAMLSVPGIFVRTKERAKEADRARERFIVHESDHLTLANVYTQWEAALAKSGGHYGRVNSWCNTNFVQLKSLLRAKDIRTQIKSIMARNNMPMYRAKSDAHVRRCLAASFYHQSAKLTKINLASTPEFVNLRHSYMKMYLHPTSCLNGSGISGGGHVIYHELVLTSKEYMNYVTAVDPMWLLEYGCKFYDIPDHFKRRNVQRDFPFEYVDSEKLRASLAADLQLMRDKKHQVKQAVAKSTKSGPKFKRRAF